MLWIVVPMYFVVVLVMTVFWMELYNVVGEVGMKSDLENAFGLYSFMLKISPSLNIRMSKGHVVR